LFCCGVPSRETCALLRRAFPSFFPSYTFAEDAKIIATIIPQLSPGKHPAVMVNGLTLRRLTSWSAASEWALLRVCHHHGSGRSKCTAHQKERPMMLRLTSCVGDLGGDNRCLGVRSVFRVNGPVGFARAQAAGRRDTCVVCAKRWCGHDS